MGKDELQQILDKVLDFTKNYTIVDLIRVSENYGDLLYEIGRSQGFNTFELSPENEIIFGDILKIKTQNIINLYNNAHQLALKNGFNKEFIRTLPKNNECIGATVTVTNFFAVIRNKRKRFQEKESIHSRRDDMSGLRNLIEQMNNLITQSRPE